MSEAKTNYLFLVKRAFEAANAYYLNNDPVMSDYEYDELIRSIRQYEAANPTDISPDSPALRKWPIRSLCSPCRMCSIPMR